MPNAALILAAGRGERIQNLIPDKILAPLAGKPVIVYSVEAFLKSGCVETIAIVYRDEPQRKALQSALVDTKISASSPRRLQDFLWIAGGGERQDSVLNGLRALPEEIHNVFIHDAARPLIAPETIRLLNEKVSSTGAACLARPVTDTIKQIRLAADALTLKTIDRSELWAMETPQVFERSLILAAYGKVCSAGIQLTDDTAALEESGHPVALVENRSPNPKITAPSDLVYMEYLLKSRTDCQR